MDSKKLDDLLKKFQEGKTTAEENEMLLKWYEKLPVDDAGSDSYRNEQLSEESEVEHRIWAKLEAHASQKTHHIGRFSHITKIAASIVLLLGLGASIYFARNTSGTQQSSMVSFVNTTNVVRFVTLEDGSKISLQPNSELKYPQHFSESTREVFLSGAAFFEIAHDVHHPFIVYARDIKTTVLGNSFTISAYDTDKEVSVKVRTGKVLVTKEKVETSKSTQASKEIFLTPNQQVVYDVETEQVALSMVEKPVLITPVPLLEIKFVRTPVAEIFEAIETAYNVDIQFDAEKIANCRITTEFSDDDDLYERIRVLCHAFGAQYNIEDMAIIIKSNGCK